MSESPETTTPIQFFPTTPPAEVTQYRITLQLEDASRVVMSRDIANQFPAFNAILTDLPSSENMVIPVVIENTSIDNIKGFFTNYANLMDQTQLRQPVTILNLIEYLTIADYLGGGVILDRIIDLVFKNAKLQYTPSQQQLLRSKYNALSSEIKAVMSNKLSEIQSYELVSDAAKEWVKQGLFIHETILITNDGRVINLVRKSDSEYDLKLDNQVLTTLNAPRNQFYDPSQFRLSYFFIGEPDPSNLAIMVTSLNHLSIYGELLGITDNTIWVNTWTKGRLISNILTRAYNPRKRRHRLIGSVISATKYSNKLFVNSHFMEKSGSTAKDEFFIVEVSPLTGEATIKITGEFSIIMEPRYGQYALIYKTSPGGQELYDLNADQLLSRIPSLAVGMGMSYTIDPDLKLIYASSLRNSMVSTYDFFGNLVSTSRAPYATYPTNPATRIYNALNLKIYPNRRVITSEFWTTHEISQSPLRHITRGFFEKFSYNIRDPRQDWRLISTIQDFDISQIIGPDNRMMQSQLVSSDNGRYVIIEFFQQGQPFQKNQLVKVFMYIYTKDQIINNLPITE